MAIVGEAEVIVVANTKGFEDQLAKESQAAVEGSGGVVSKAEQAGNDIGAGLGSGIGSGVKDETAKLGESAAKDAEKAGGKFAEAFKKPLGAAQEALQSFGIPESLVTGWGGVAVAVGGVAAASLDLGVKMQKIDAQIAAAAGISTAQATKIGNAFLDTAGKSEFSGQQMGKAFATVAGQLKAVEGHALTTAESMKVIDSAEKLATASGTDLTASTQAVVNSMQAFQVKAGQSETVTAALFGAARATGQGIGAVSDSLDRVRTRLGSLSPSIGQLSGLLVDMANHGETGRQAMSALQTTFQTLLAPAAAQAKAQNDLKAAFASLPPSVRGIAEQYQKGLITSSQFSKETRGLTTTQAAAVAQFKSASQALVKASQAQAALGIQVTNSKGQLLPLGKILDELKGKLHGMTTEQATAELSALGFGSSAAKLLPIIEAGSAALDQSTKSTTNATAVNTAAAQQSQTLEVQWQTLKATVVDLGTQLGQELIPIFEQLAQLLGPIAQLLGTTLKTAFEILGPVIKGVTELLKPLVSALSGLMNFVSDVFKGHWSAAWKDIEQVFRGIWGSIKAFVETLPERIFGPFGPRIVSVLKGFMGAIEKVGEDLIMGLVHGIEHGYDVVKRTVENVGHHVLKAFKDVLSILSPSRETYDIGTNVVKGLVNGINDSASTAVNAAGKMARGVKTAANPGNVRAGLEGAGSREGGVTVHVHQGAVNIHPAPGNTAESLLATEKMVDEAFRLLGQYLNAGATANGRVHA